MKKWLASIFYFLFDFILTESICNAESEQAECGNSDNIVLNLTSITNNQYSNLSSHNDDMNII